MSADDVTDAVGSEEQTTQDMDQILSRVVDAKGDVDYADLSGLDDAMRAVAAGRIEAVEGDAGYAFLLNAYNLAVLDAARRVLVRSGARRSLANPLVRFRFFFLTLITVAGRRMSLYTLEFRYLKPFLRRDPRGHFALVCASGSCPPLRGGAYHAKSLDDDLELAGKAFFRPGAYRLDREAGTLHLNRILKWHASDFAPETATDVFLRFAPEDDADWVRAHRPRVAWLPYDWDLNVAKT